PRPEGIVQAEPRVGRDMRTSRRVGVVAAVLLITSATYVAAVPAAADDPDTRTPIEVPNQPTDRRGLPIDQASPARADGTNGGELPQLPGVSWKAAEFGSPSLFFPPDTMGAVGPTQFLTVIN